MRPTPDIALSVVRSASRARRCATDKPSGKRDLRNPSDAELARVNADHHIYAVFGALVNIVDELPSNVPAQHTDDVVSLSPVPAANCKPASTESWERVLSVLPLGDDIFPHTAQKSSRLSSA